MMIEKHKKKLLVEGKNDQHVVWAICEQAGIDENFDVVESGGKDGLLESLSVRFKSSEINTIGVILDADTDLKARWQSLRDRLEGLGFATPDKMPVDGLIVSRDDGKKVGAWIMPNNNENGMIEDFISYLVPADDKLWPIARSTIDHIETNKLNKYSLVHNSKALIHSWLAWQETPGAPLGQSITNKYLSTSVASCQVFIDWIKELFKNWNQTT